MASYPFHIPFMTMQIEIMTWSSIISSTIRCFKMKAMIIHNDMRTGIRMGTNPVKIHPVECPLDLEQNRMGLLNSENEDVTNVTSESSNPYTSLKFQRTRWKWNAPWTWPMSPPLTSSDITCNQHSFRFQTNVFTQWLLHYHQICNLEAEPMKMNELFDGREDHSLIPSIPWY